MRWEANKKYGLQDGNYICCELKIWIEQKGMTFDHDFGYFFPFFFTPKKKREEEKENEVAKKRDKKSCLSCRS